MRASWFTACYWQLMFRHTNIIRPLGRMKAKSCKQHRGFAAPLTHLTGLHFLYDAEQGCALQSIRRACSGHAACETHLRAPERRQRTAHTRSRKQQSCVRTQSPTPPTAAAVALLQLPLAMCCHRTLTAGSQKCHSLLCSAIVAGCLLSMLL